MIPGELSPAMLPVAGTLASGRGRLHAPLDGIQPLSTGASTLAWTERWFWTNVGVLSFSTRRAVDLSTKTIFNPDAD